MPRIIFAWDCDAGFWGHVRYAAGKLAGRSCGLCDLSYAGVRPSDAFTACRDSMPIPIVPLYRDQLSPPLSRAIGGAFPAVVFEFEGGANVLFGPAEIAAFEDFAALECALREAVERA